MPDDSKATSKYLDEKYSDPVEDIVRLDAEMEKSLRNISNRQTDQGNGEVQKMVIESDQSCFLGEHTWKTEEGRTVSWED